MRAIGVRPLIAHRLSPLAHAWWGGLLRLALPLLLVGLALTQAPPAEGQVAPTGTWVNRLADHWVSQLQMNLYNNDEVFAAGNDPNGNVFVFRTTDGGNTWTDVSRGRLPQFSVFALAIAPGHPQTLLIGGFNIPQHVAGLWRTDDSGATWFQMPGAQRDIGNRSIQALMFDVATEKIIWVGTDDGLFQSRDNGQSWQMLGGGGISHQNIHVVTAERQWSPARQYNPFDTWVGADATTGGGAWRSADLGGAWQFVNAGLPATNTVYQFATDPTRWGFEWAAVDTGPGTTPSLWRTVLASGGNDQVVPAAPWRLVAQTERIAGMAIETLTNQNDGNHNLYYSSPSGLYLGREQGDGMAFQKVSQVGANGPIQLGTTAPQRLYVGGKGVSVWVTGTTPIPMTLAG